MRAQFLFGAVSSLFTVIFDVQRGRSCKNFIYVNTYKITNHWYMHVEENSCHTTNHSYTIISYSDDSRSGSYKLQINNQMWVMRFGVIFFFAKWDLV